MHRCGSQQRHIAARGAVVGRAQGVELFGYPVHSPAVDAIATDKASGAPTMARTSADRDTVLKRHQDVRLLVSFTRATSSRPHCRIRITTWRADSRKVLLL